MKMTKWKKIVLISSLALILIAIIAVFWVIIANTANMNSFISITANDCLGTVAINIKNADNGMPYSYFTFEYTTKGDKTHEFENKNLLFKSDTEPIIIEFTIHNQAFYKTNLAIDTNGPGRNSKVEFKVDGVETDQTDLIVLEPNEIKTITYVVSKKNPASAIRAKYKMYLSLTKYVES